MHNACMQMVCGIDTFMVTQSQSSNTTWTCILFHHSDIMDSGAYKSSQQLLQFSQNQNRRHAAQPTSQLLIAVGLRDIFVALLNKIQCEVSQLQPNCIP